MVRQRMLKIIRSKETCQIAMVTRSRQKKKDDNLNNVRREAGRYFWNKQREYLKKKK
jgi:hypothetical protein